MLVLLGLAALQIVVGDAWARVLPVRGGRDGGRLHCVHKGVARATYSQ